MICYNPGRCKSFGRHWRHIMRKSGNEETIRIGIVGAGGNTRARHIPGLRAIPGVEIVSVANRTQESSERAAKELGIPRAYRNWLELVSADDTDAILIGTWPNMHCAVTIEALECNKHVLCEARMARNANEAHAMLDASLRHPHLVAQLVPAPFTLAIDRTVQRLISEGFLGDLVAVDLQAQSGDFPDYDAPLHWRQDADISGFNMLTMGIWYESLMRWIGPAKIVTAMTETVVNVRRDDQGTARTVAIPDHIEVLARMLRGGTAHMRFSAATGLAPRNEIWLFGDEGTLRIETKENRIYGGRRGQSALEEIPVRPEEREGWRVEAEFVNAIRGLEQVRRTTFEDGVRYMEFTEAAWRSAQSGQPVMLPL
jgi:predicted dehydrogenase